jgi:hypothetical protein
LFLCLTFSHSTLPDKISSSLSSLHVLSINTIFFPHFPAQALNVGRVLPEGHSSVLT